MILDFKKVSPRFDKQNITEITEHNTIIVDLVLLKDVVTKLTQLIDELEKRFGEIKGGDFFKKLREESEKKIKEIQKKNRKKWT